MRYTSFIPLLWLAALAACETTIDPATGQTQTTWTLPLTQSNAEAAEQQWQQCVLYSSESYCERTLPDGRPPGVQPVIWARDNDP
jgi:hypothetical protein